MRQSIAVLVVLLAMCSQTVTVAGEKSGEHWAFQPLLRPAVPAVMGGAHGRGPIDSFIGARLEADHLEPSVDADRVTLLRRVTLDLVGLPPTPEEVDEFLADTRPGAYQRLVDRLLASPHYGERWGRHWLDLARYADSNGYTRDFGREIWLYRDWVIKAFNRDLPFDRFTIEQFAGDLLPDATTDQIVATGFHRNTLINEEGGTDQEEFRVEAVADRVATTGLVFLGLTVGCARCHTHKYDPISQKEYYRLFAFLNDSDEPTIELPSPEQVRRGEPGRRAEIRRRIKTFEEELGKHEDAFVAAQLAWEKSLTPQMRSKLPGPTQEALQVPLAKRTPEQKPLVEELFKKTDEARKAFPAVDGIAKLRASEPRFPKTMVMKRRGERRATHVMKRGNFLDRGVEVSAAVPAFLPPARQDGGEPSRLSFARWLVDSANPLTPRVVVNRFWQRLFGLGIVQTENDFGIRGAPPSHPALLDWLASEFIRRQWSMKAIHRVIVTSSTYRQASRHRRDLAKIDPGNRLLARQSRLRVEAEIIRDAALAASGLLTGRIGGPGEFPPQPDGVFDFTQDQKPWKTTSGAENYRRGMYTHFWRSSPYPALVVFDFPDSNVTCTRRPRSSTPLQALTLANDPVFVECAQELGVRALGKGLGGDMARVRHVFRRCLARVPGPAESKRLLELLERQRGAFGEAPEAAAELVSGRVDRQTDVVELAAWTALCRVLLNLDEFITRE